MPVVDGLDEGHFVFEHLFDARHVRIGKRRGEYLLELCGVKDGQRLRRLAVARSREGTEHEYAPTDHARAIHTELPVGVPSMRPRTASVTWLTG